MGNLLTEIRDSIQDGQNKSTRQQHKSRTNTQTQNNQSLCQTLLTVIDNNLLINTVIMSVNNTAMVSITVSVKYLILLKEIVLYYRIIHKVLRCLVSESAV